MSDLSHNYLKRTELARRETDANAEPAMKKAYRALGTTPHDILGRVPFRVEANTDLLEIRDAPRPRP